MSLTTWGGFQETCSNPLWCGVFPPQSSKWLWHYIHLFSLSVTKVGQSLIIYYLCKACVMQKNPYLKHFKDSWSGRSVFEAPAAPQLYAAQKNNKPWWMLGWAGRSKRQGNHLRGREPWGIEEKEASEYVSSAKPISKWLPAPCSWKLKRENREI